jgi:hypothetical protein
MLHLILQIAIHITFFIIPPLTYIAGSKINIKNNVNAIIITQVTTEIIAIALFFFIIPTVNPKIPTINKSDKNIKVN